MWNHQFFPVDSWENTNDSVSLKYGEQLELNAQPYFLSRVYLVYYFFIYLKFNRFLSLFVVVWYRVIIMQNQVNLLIPLYWISQISTTAIFQPLNTSKVMKQIKILLSLIIYTIWFLNLNFKTYITLVLELYSVSF